MKEPVIVFDLGGVLVDWNPRHLYRQIFRDQTKMEWFLSNVCTGEWNGILDTGVSFEDNTRALIQRFPEFESEIKAWFDRWEEMFSGPIHGTVEIFEELKAKGHTLYALTNWSKETWPRGRKLFPFFERFDGHVVSGEVGVKKPDRRIFEHLFSRFELTPRDTVFIDDLLPNIDVARELGMKAIHFRSPDALRRELTELGVL